MNATPSGTWFGWGAKAVYVETETHGSTTAKTHTVYATYVDANGETVKEALFDSRDAITLDKIENGVLYYTSNTVTYTRDLATNQTSEFYAKSLSNYSTTGWAKADVVGNYIFALTTNNASVARYDAETEKNSTATNITLVQEIEE